MTSVPPSQLAAPLRVGGGDAVRVRGLCKRYREVIALNGVDLDIRRGEIFALLGPNGAGKTTAVEILEGHRRRDAGQVAVLGTDPFGAGRAWRARIGIVPQGASDFPELRVHAANTPAAPTRPGPGRHPGLRPAGEAS